MGRIRYGIRSERQPAALRRPLHRVELHELQALQELLANQPRFVVATGGSIVSESATYELLLRSCFTIWIRTSPEEHMQRVLAQGDLRPMAGSQQAMDDLRRILDERGELYGRADAVVDTTGESPDESLRQLASALQS